MDQALPSVSDLFKRAWTRFWANLGTLLIISAILFGISLIVSYFFGGMDFVKSTLGIGPTPKVMNTGGIGRTLVIGGLLTIFAGLANIIANGLMFARLHFANESVFSLFALVRQRAGVLIVASLLSGLAVLVGALALIIPGIIIGLMLAFTEAVVIIEKQGVMASINRSRALSKGLLGSLFIRFFAFFIVLLLLSLVIQRVSFGATATGLFFTPFGLVYLYELYLALYAIKTPNPNN